MVDDDIAKIKVEDFDLNKRFPNYFKKWIFRTGVIIMVVLLFYILFLNNFELKQHPYISCPENSLFACKNAFFECNQNITLDYTKLQPEQIQCDQIKKLGCMNGICDKEYLQAGEIVGTPPSQLITFYPLIVLGIIIICFLTNHLLYLMRKDK
jgi:hypothetical protein